MRQDVLNKSANSEFHDIDRTVWGLRYNAFWIPSKYIYITKWVSDHFVKFYYKNHVNIDCLHNTYQVIDVCLSLCTKILKSIKWKLLLRLYILFQTINSRLIDVKYRETSMNRFKLFSSFVNHTRQSESN